MAILTPSSQQEATRKKRKDRDIALKTKADKARKRKRNAQIEPISSIEEAVAQAELETSLPEENASLISKVDIHNLPNLLPAEYLEDDDKSRDLNSVVEPTKKRAKKTKFTDPSNKHPKDRRIGATTYRVTKTTSMEMAPKSAFHARRTKESWLQGRFGKNEEVNRKPFSKGFLKK
jgi:U3 small nucleolar RNA-associated protein 16